MNYQDRGRIEGCGDPLSKAPIGNVGWITDSAEYATALVDRQADTLVRRFRISREHAALVAGLAFSRRPRR